ncbi:MAG: GNAT family N-acetyltransferase [Planctomycetota bacterium]|nr:GNAT family N-acetyltransferase [Planctomycetota bacterium]
MLSLTYRPLTPADIPELAAVLRNSQVFQHIGGVPSEAEFALGLQRAILGPPTERSSERWLNYVVRLTDTSQAIGRVEATLHHGIAEVAFLYGPEFWGKGYAYQGLTWLHEQFQEEVSAFWATTTPANARSIKLLHRCGYVPAPTTNRPVLHSYDEGDLVFVRSTSPSAGPCE